MDSARLLIWRMAPALVDHEDAVLHVLDDELIDLRKVGEVDLALRDDRPRWPTARRASGMRLASRWRNRQRSACRPAHRAWSIREEYDLVGVFAQYRDGRQRGEEQLSAGPRLISPTAASETSKRRPRPLLMPPLKCIISVMNAIVGADIDGQLHREVRLARKDRAETPCTPKNR